MALFIFLGLMTAFLACTCFYLASPHQRCRKTILSARTAVTMRLLALLLLVLSQFALMQALQTLAAVFVFMTTVMLMLIALPYLGAWLGSRRSS